MSVINAGQRKLEAEWRALPHGVPVARYVDPAFAQLEADRLWPRVWQVACRLEEIPSPGSYVVYEILDHSIVVVRQQDMSVKAFHNVCPHRGTALAVGSGRYQRQQIICPFHGWQWDIAGDNIFVRDPGEFRDGCLDPKSLHLKEVQVATFINCAWINMDPAAAPFDEWIAPVREAFEATLVADMYVDWHRSFTVEANWKVALEAFLEGYHVAQTHPQLARRQIKPRQGISPDQMAALSRLNYALNSFPQGHSYGGNAGGGVRGLGRFPREWMEGYTAAEEVEHLISFHEHFYREVQAMVLADDVEVARTMRRRPIPEDGDVDSEFQRVIREHYALQGRAIASPEALARVTLAHVFPNYAFLPLYGNVLIYRSRPIQSNDPNRCRFDIWSCRTYPEGSSPKVPETQHVTDPVDPAQMPMLLRQDFTNIPRQQIGLRSRGLSSTLLHGGQEGMIANFHRALDQIIEQGT